MQSRLAETKTLSPHEIEATLKREGREEFPNAMTNPKPLVSSKELRLNVAKTATAPALPIRSEHQPEVDKTLEAHSEVVRADRRKSPPKMRSPSNSSPLTVSRGSSTVGSWDMTIDSEGERSFVGGSNQVGGAPSGEHDEVTLLSRRLARSVLHVFASWFLKNSPVSDLGVESTGPCRTMGHPAPLTPM